MDTLDSRRSIRSASFSPPPASLTLRSRRNILRARPTPKSLNPGVRGSNTPKTSCRSSSTSRRSTAISASRASFWTVATASLAEGAAAALEIWPPALRADGVALGGPNRRSDFRVGCKVAPGDQRAQHTERRPSPSRNSPHSALPQTLGLVARPDTTWAAGGQLYTRADRDSR